MQNPDGLPEISWVPLSKYRHELKFSDGSADMVFINKTSGLQVHLFLRGLQNIKLYILIVKDAHRKTTVIRKSFFVPKGLNTLFPLLVDVRCPL